MIKLRYAPSGTETVVEHPFEELEMLLRQGGWTWVDVTEPTLDEIAEIGGLFDIDDIDLDDVIQPAEHPKIEDRGGYIFVITHTPSSAQDRFRTVEIDSFLGPNWVVTFHREKSMVIDALSAAAAAEPIGGPDLILALTLDVVGRRFLGLVDGLDEAIDELEEMAIDGEQVVLGRVQSLRRDALRLRSVLRPQQDVLRILSRSESNLIKRSSKGRFAGSLDDYLRINDSLDTARMLLASVLDTYRGTVAERMNEIMKVLTVFAAIVLPLGLMAGIYGMNFANMRELQWDWAYYALLGLMAAVAIGLWSYFAKRGFIGRPPRVDEVVTKGLAGMVHLTLAPARGLIHLVTTGAHLDKANSDDPSRTD